MHHHVEGISRFVLTAHRYGEVLTRVGLLCVMYISTIIL
jgi:hypothetical protein